MENTNEDYLKALHEFNISLAKSINEVEGGKSFSDEHFAYAITLVGLCVCNTFQKISDKITTYLGIS